MVALLAGDHYNSGCCFDYGNAEIDALDEGKGTMEAIYWGNSTGWSPRPGPALTLTLPWPSLNPNPALAQP